jgi:hypothetical protein
LPTSLAAELHRKGRRQTGKAGVATMTARARARGRVRARARAGAAMGLAAVGVERIVVRGRAPALIPGFNADGQTFWIELARPAARERRYDQAGW